MISKSYIYKRTLTTPYIYSALFELYKRGSPVIRGAFDSLALSVSTKTNFLDFSTSSSSALHSFVGERSFFSTIKILETINYKYEKNVKTKPINHKSPQSKFDTGASVKMTNPLKGEIKIFPRVDNT
tara:strand:+ start:189 stop:569 length:381 start_codon:yes stop_codon:yes gene_type:complete